MSQVLIVDDHSDNLYLLRMLLEGHGFNVTEARHGVEALAKARAVPQNLIISDLLMPVMDGFTLLKEWKADPQLRSIPFVVYTATYTDPKDERLALNLGADAFIIKPAEPEPFMARIREVFEMKERPAVIPSNLEARDLVKDYSEVLINKLEKRAIQLEQANRALRAEIAEREKVEASLRAAELQFRLSIEGVKDHAIFMLDINGTVASWNTGAERIYGYTAAEIVGRHYACFFSAEEQARGEPQRELNLTVKSGRLTELGWRVRQDGSRFWADGSTTTLIDENGNLHGFSKVVRDLTEWKRIDDALRMSEERYRTLIAATTAIVWSSPATGAFDTEQQGWTNFTGQTVAEHREFGWLDAIHPEDREPSRLAWITAMRERSVYELEHRVRRADGVYRYMSVRAFPLFESDGTVREWIGAHTDLTDQKQAEAELRLRDRAIWAASEGMVITDPSRPGNPILYVNPAFEKITGYGSAEVVGRNCRFLQGKETDPNAIAQLRDAVAAGRACSVELVNYRKDGSPFWNALSIAPVRDEAGQLTHFVGVQADVSARRNLEDQFRQVQKMEAVGQLAGGVAHDFNNHLTIINGYSEMLLQMLLPEDRNRDWVAEIHAAGERSARLTRQLLAFSRQQVLSPQILDLNAVVSDTDRMLRRLIGEDISLTATLAPDLAAVRGDAGQIEQVLMNLAVNARDAMPEGGQLTIETRNVQLDKGYTQTHADAKAGAYVLLSMSDTGCGIAPDVQARIFEPFFTTKGPGKGTGLGLSTVYGIVKQSGGFIAVYSEVGLGTTFKVYFPQVARSEAPQLESRAAELPRGSETILLVEDDENVRSLTAHVLLGLGYTVFAAADGGEAVRMAAETEQPIHLLITDVVMPVAGGRVVAQRVAERHPKVKILYVSGYTDDAVVRHGILEETIHFLPKPFTQATLAAKVRAILDGTV